MKTCPHCLQEKRSNHFYKNAANADGLSVLCKPCYRDYEASPERRAKRTWNTLQTRIRLQPAYAHVEIRMTRDEFLAWAIPEYERWMHTHPSETPSLDRVDAASHYELNNLRVIARGENARLARNHLNVHAPHGKAWCHGCRAYLETESFWRSRNAFNGLQKRCKACQTQAIADSRRRAAP